MPSNPKIQREGDKLFVMTAIGRCEIAASHPDRTRPRWWRLIGPDGKPLSPYVAAPRIAAAWAAQSAAASAADKAG